MCVIFYVKSLSFYAVMAKSRLLSQFSLMRKVELCSAGAVIWWAWTWTWGHKTDRCKPLLSLVGCHHTESAQVCGILRLPAEAQLTVRASHTSAAWNQVPHHTNLQRRDMLWVVNHRQKLLLSVYKHCCNCWLCNLCPDTKMVGWPIPFGMSVK